jgi:hypothetical protein
VAVSVASDFMSSMPLLLLLLLLAEAAVVAPGLPLVVAPLLRVELLANSSAREWAVLEVQHASVPAATKWFRVAPASPTAAPGGGCGGGGCWLPRTAPKPAGQLPQGVQQLPFRASCEFDTGCVLAHHNYTYVVEAWSDRSDLGDGASATLLAASPPLLYTYDNHGFASGLRFGNFTASEHAPGHVTVACLPNSPALFAMVGQIVWFGYRVASEPAAGLPTFSIDEDAVDGVYSPRLTSPPRISVSYSFPGVYFVGMYGAFSGDETGGALPDLGVRTAADFPSGPTGWGTFQPFAVVVPFENGTVPPLPARFAGPSHTTGPIPGDIRLALHRSSLTVFDGGTVYLQNVKGPPGFGINLPGPHVVEIDVPIGMWAQDSLRGDYNVSNATDAPGGGTVSVGYQRLRLTNINSNVWGFLNWDVRLQLSVAAGLAGCTFKASQARAYTGAQNQARSENWQPLSLTVRALEPLPHGLPKRLQTGFCWDGWSEFGWNESLSVQIWRRLGFNIIPSDGVSSVANTLPSSERVGPEWDGLKYGVMMNLFGGGGPVSGEGTIAALKFSVASAQSFNLSSVGVTQENLAAERDKLVSAAQFYQAHKVLDISYDGVFFQNDVAQVAAIVEHSRPDFLSFDVEQLPPFEVWAKVAPNSSNFLRRHAASERGTSFSETALAIAQGLFGAVVSRAREVQPTLQPALYDAYARFDLGFQLETWPMLQAEGFASSPSCYDQMNSLDRLAATVRAERLAVGLSTAVRPWLSPGQTTSDGGAPPEDTDPGLAMYNSLLQVLCSGATGFSLYTSDGFVDGSIWLAVRDAVALVTPYEDLLIDGTPTPTGDIFGLSPNAVVSGMSAAASSGGTGGSGEWGGGAGTGAILIASSSLPFGTLSTFSVKSAAAAAQQRQHSEGGGGGGGWLLCDLERTTVSVEAGADGVASWTSPVENGTLLLFGADTPCHHQLL